MNKDKFLSLIDGEAKLCRTEVSKILGETYATATDAAFRAGYEAAWSILSRDLYYQAPEGEKPAPTTAETVAFHKFQTKDAK